MSEDFYIKFLGSDEFRNEGTLILYDKDSEGPRVKALLPLLSRLVHEETSPEGFHPCPICGHDLMVSFLRILGNSTLSINTYCKTCSISSSFETNEIPFWAPKPKSWREIFKETGIHRDDNG
jgi:hypothetical protein